MKANRWVILNVDKNGVWRNSVASALAADNYILHTARSKEECFALAELHQPDVVLVPWELAGVAGTEICALLKVAPEPRSLVILRVPAAQSTDIAATLSNCRADAFLPERAGDALVLATVGALLRGRNSQPQLAAGEETTRMREDAYRFASRVSHDLGEPLRMMTTFGEMLGEDSPDRLTADEKTYLGFVLGGIERTRRLLHYMLEYTRVDAEQSNRGPVTLSLVVDLALNSLRKRIEDAGATIEVEQPLPLVKGNAQELQKVFQSLIGNALKYHRPGEPAKVSIKAVKHSSVEWLISVADKGIGIPQRYHESIFRSFERLHGREIPGSGMGLALAKKILEAQQGRIWVESELGQGATFFFTQPAWDE